MKKALLLLIVFAFGFTVNRIYDEKVKNLLAQLKISEDNAEQTIFSNISGPSFYILATAELKKIADGERPSVIAVAAKYIKEYSSSQEFINKYNEYRETKKPIPPQKPQTVAEMKENYKKSIEEGIASMEQLIIQMPDQKATFEETIKAYKEQLKEVDNPDNPMFSPDMEKMMMDGYNQQMEIHKQEVAEWEEEYPANNPNKMVRKWLTTFLESSRDVDFNAKLKPGSNDKIIFANPDYEKKSYLWKLCFRSGEETLQAARTSAQNWLKELN